MLRFTHKFREKFEDLRKRHWGKDCHKFGKCAPLLFLGPQAPYERCCAWVSAWVGKCVGGQFSKHKLLGESVIPADLLRPCRIFF